MQIKIFLVPVISGESANEELNKFLRSQKILDVDKHIVTHKDAVFWTFCVTYIPTGPLGSSTVSERREKTDYKQVLDESAFAVFTKLRTFRKRLADRDAIPAYAVFTDAELAEIAKIEHITPSAIRSVSGIGEKKIEKYGVELCKLLDDETNRLLD